MERRTLFKLGAALSAAMASLLVACQSPAQAAAGVSGTTTDRTSEFLVVAQPLAPSTGISIDDDPYKQGIFYRSELGVVRSPNASIRWTLVGRKLRRYDIRSYYIEVLIEYGAVDWVLYDQAITDSGATLSLVPSGRDISSCAAIGRCTYREALDVGLREAHMRQGAAEGLTVRLLARSGRAADITVPPSLFRALLAEME
jgi:hypothetical protein